LRSVIVWQAAWQRRCSAASAWAASPSLATKPITKQSLPGSVAALSNPYFAFFGSLVLQLLSSGPSLKAVRERLQRGVGGDWLFDVSLWVHEWDRLMMMLWDAHLSQVGSSSSSSSRSSSSSESKYHVSLSRSVFSSL
jgi:hypothetical protein